MCDSAIAMDEAALIASLRSAISWDDCSHDTAFTAVNSDLTVSPQDIMLDSYSGSPSASLTNLTTPASAMLDTSDESSPSTPLFDDSLVINQLQTAEWFPLFTAEAKPIPLPSPATTTESQVVVHPGGESRRTKRVSVASTPITDSRRPSSSAGIHKTGQALPPIVVDERDTVALKRARNTAAARKSRDKKFKDKSIMEARIAELEEEVRHWKSLALAAV